MNQCPGCLKGFASREMLAAHLMQLPEQRRPPCAARACTGCGKAFASADACSNHESTCDRVFPCPGCKKLLSSAALLRAHVLSSRASCSGCVCRGCGALCSDPEARTRHERQCEAAHTCPGCHTCFCSLGELAAHIAKPARARPSCSAAACVGCAHVFSDAVQCSAHEETCWRVFLCPGCDGHFGSVAAFQAHHRDRNRGVGFVAQRCTASQCVTCGMVFSSHEECVTHSLLHRVSQRGYPQQNSSHLTSPRGLHEPLRRNSVPPNPQPRYGFETGAAGACKQKRKDPGVPEAAGAAFGVAGGGARSSSPGGPDPRAEHPLPPPEPQEAIRELSVELGTIHGAFLRARLRQLQLQWHPDKACRQSIEPEVACQVFGFVQSVWETRVLAPTVPS